MTSSFLGSWALTMTVTLITGTSCSDDPAGAPIDVRGLYLLETVDGRLLPHSLGTDSIQRGQGRVPAEFFMGAGELNIGTAGGRYILSWTSFAITREPGVKPDTIALGSDIVGDSGDFDYDRPNVSFSSDNRAVAELMHGRAAGGKLDVSGTVLFQSGRSFDWRAARLGFKSLP